MLLYSSKPGERAIILGRYEPQITNLIFKLVKENNIVFDIGSWIGYYAIVAAAKNARVYAIELDPENVKRIDENVALNDFGDRVTVLNVGVASERGHAIINPVDYEFKRRISLEENATGINVQTNTLDNITQDNNVSKIDLIIMDIEGEEYNAILGMKNLLGSRSIQHLIIELHRDVIEQQGHSYTEIITMLEQFGYRWELIGRPDEKLKPHLYGFLS